MKIRICGTDHRHARVEVRELLALAEERLPTALHELVAVDGVREAAILSTCNRFELIYVGETVCEGEIYKLLGRWAGVPADRLTPHLVRHDDDDAARHLFRVASSLESMVLGESQITGQVKEAYRIANEAGTIGPMLHRLFHKSFAVAKRVRTETGVGAATLSVAQAAVDMAQVIFDDLSRHPVLLLGAGEMSELALRGFKTRGVNSLWVTNRTLSRATEVATALGAGVVPWEQRAKFLAQVDVVLCSTGARKPVLSREDVVTARKLRKGRPLLLIDISVPRNLDPAINDVASVYLFDIDDLSQSVQVNQESRQREAARADGIVELEVGRFERLRSDVQVAPLLRNLHRRMSQESEQEVQRSLRAVASVLEQLDGDGRKAVEDAFGKMATSLGKRFLHHPLQRLKELGNEGERAQLAAAADLFGIEAILMEVRDGEEREGVPAGSDDADAGAEPARLKQAVGAERSSDEN